MRTKFYILSIFIILSTCIWSENKTYITTLYTTPTHQQVALPVMLNKTNLNGDNFSNKDLLATFISQPSITEYTEVLKADLYDRFHLPKATRDARFYYLSFRLSANKYNRASLRITAPSMYEVYINDTKEVAKTTIEDSLSNAKVTKINFSVLPSSTYNVVIKYMSLASNKAPEEIYISVQPEDDKQSVDYFFSKAGDKRSITIRDILEGKRITSTNISPDGNFVLLKYTTTKKDGKTYSDNVLMSLKDTKEIILSPYQSYAWMPATNKLYYSDNRSGENKLILLDPNTLEETVFANDIPEGWFYFTPDEKKLIYSVEEKAKSPSSDLILLTAPESVQPRNGDRTFLAEYDLSTGVQQRLTFGKNSTKIQDISSDSRFILYSVTEYDATRRPFNFNSLYKLDLTDLSVDTLFTNQGFASSAEFSPDGSKILILGSAEAFDGIGNTLPATEIPNAYNKLAFVMDIVSKQITVITKNFVPSVDRAYWSRHDGLIYLQATAKDYVKVYTYDTESKKITSLNLDEDIVSAFDLSTKSSKVVYYGMSASNFTKAYTLDLKKGKSTLIADPDKKLIDQLNLSKITDWSFTSSTGTTIDGRYYLPPNFDASKKYPLIVYYYGGTVPTPRTLSAPYPAQVYAALGYVVYVLQPSGAIGYGPQFAARHVNGWGKENAHDIIEGTKKFIEEHSFVNEKKIGCIGASYGGYMTMYLQTQTHLFAAAVSHAGISSISSYWGEGYWGYTYSSGASAGSYPWNNPELYVKQSPLFNADKINTPLLLLHGTVDTNVPIGESMQMYTALKILGKPVEFIQVKGENHGIKNFKKRIEWNNSIYAWFAKWLQDDSSWWDNLYKTN